MTKKVIVALSGVASVAMLAAVCANVFVITKLQPGVLDTVLSALLILTSVSGIYYILAGGKKKEGAAYYHWFMVLFAFVGLITLVSLSGSAVSVLCFAVAYGCLCVVAAAKDLGKTKSLILILAVVAAALVQGFLSVNAQGQDVLIRSWTVVVLALVSLLMTVAKYVDKASRGSK